MTWERMRIELENVGAQKVIADSAGKSSAQEEVSKAHFRLERGLGALRFAGREC